MGKQQNQKLLPHHHTIMRMLLRGVTKSKIAEAMGLTLEAISIITNSDIFKAELDKRQAKLYARVEKDEVDCRAKLEKLRKIGIDQLEAMLIDKSGVSNKLRAEIIFDVLDRTEAKPNETSDSSSFAEQAKSAWEKRKQILAQRNTEQEALPAPSESKELAPRRHISFAILERGDKPEENEVSLPSVESLIANG